MRIRETAEFFGTPRLQPTVQERCRRGAVPDPIYGGLMPSGGELHPFRRRGSRGRVILARVPPDESAVRARVTSTKVASMLALAHHLEEAALRAVAGAFVWTSSANGTNDFGRAFVVRSPLARRAFEARAAFRRQSSSQWMWPR